MSSPCSVPSVFRLLLPEEPPPAQAACAAHDLAYARGGGERDRALADARFLVALLESDLSVTRAHAYYSTVRAFGAAYWGAPVAGPAVEPIEAP